MLKGDCLRIGPLHDVVQRLDEGMDARSLHHLAGLLHAAAGDETAKKRWVAAVRDRFAATQAASFECDFDAWRGDLLIADPPDGLACGPAIGVLKSHLHDLAVGEAAAIYDAPGAGGVLVSAAAVKCGPKRAVGFALARPADAVNDSTAIVQYLSAIAWHLQCADAALGRVRMPGGRMSPLDWLDLLPLPCVITDSAGRAIERNEAFAEFMEASALRISLGRMRFDDPYLQDSWLVALSEVDVTALRQSLLASAADGRQWRVHLVPLRCALEPDDPTERQLIFATVEMITSASVIDNLLMEAARPLTNAEQEVLGALLQGHTAKVIATARRASVNTVRSQIMAILEKTGHHNQKSLMAAFSPSSFRSSNSEFGASISGIRSSIKR